jgi:hypothetical protein
MKGTYKPPLLPEGSEIYIGLGIATILGITLVLLGFPWWSYTAAALVSFLAFVYAFQVWTEGDRQYFKGMQIMDNARKDLDIIEGFSRYIKNVDARLYVVSGVKTARLIIDELSQQQPTKMYGGISLIAPHVQRMLCIEEYVDIQNNPRKAGRNALELMTKTEQGFQGFSEEMDLMYGHITAGDIFNLTTNAELLRSLRSLLPKSKEQSQ